MLCQGVQSHLVDVKREQTADSHKLRAARAGDSHEDDNQHQRHAALAKDILQQQELTLASDKGNLQQLA